MSPGLPSEGDFYDREQVINIINSVIRKMQEHEGVSREVVCAELLSLKNMVDDLRTQLLSSDAGDISGRHIPIATDELGAVVLTTEKATTKIMESCESITEILNDAPPSIRTEIESYIIDIFEACTFQDITGQRIRKVEKALRMIDEKASALMRVLERHLTHGKTMASHPVHDDEQSLLNGPAMPDDAMSQDEIDKLLSTLGN